MKRLTNPKNYMSNMALLNLPIIRHNGELFRVLKRDESYIKTGSCQCYKDCNCAEDRGKKVEIYTTYFRKLKHDGTDKAFYEDIDYIPRDYKTNPYKENQCYLCKEPESQVTQLIIEGDRYVCDNCIINR